MVRRGSDECQPMRLHHFREARVLRQEAVAWMDRVGARDMRRPTGSPECSGSCRAPAGGPIQTLSSASRTCIASASAVECTATVPIPISRQARWMRSAISPRLAIRIFWNNRVSRKSSTARRTPPVHRSDQDLRHRAGPGRLDLVECLHRFDQEQGLASRDGLADGDEAGGAWLRRGDRPHPPWG